MSTMERVLELERQLNELRRQVEFLQNSDPPAARMSLRSRIVKTVDNGNYPPNSTATGLVYPVIFQDGAENDRQATAQKDAKNLASGWLAPGSKSIAINVDGNWFMAIGSALPPDASGVKLAKITSTVTARSGDTPGTGAATVWQFTNGVLAPTAEQLTVYNLGEYELPDDDTKIVWLVQETTSSRWMVIPPFWSEIEGVSPGGGQVVVPFYYGDRIKFTSLGDKPVVDKQTLRTITITLPESSTILRKAFCTQEIQDRLTGSISILDPEKVVTAVTKAAVAQVTTSTPHEYQTGDTVRMFPDFSSALTNGMFQLSSWVDYNITVIDATNFTIPVDTTSFNDWTGGRCARTTAGTGVNQFGHVGRALFNHTEIWVRRRSEDSNWDVLHPAWDGTTNVQATETILRGDRGDATIRDSSLRIRLQADWLIPNFRQIDFGANASAYYWKTVPPGEPGAVVGRPYVFMLANLNCDDLGTAP